MEEDGGLRKSTVCGVASVPVLDEGLAVEAAEADKVGTEDDMDTLEVVVPLGEDMLEDVVDFAECGMSVEKADVGVCGGGGRVDGGLMDGRESRGDIGASDT